MAPVSAARVAQTTLQLAVKEAFKSPSKFVVTMPWNRGPKTLKVQKTSIQAPDAQIYGGQTIMFGSFVVSLGQTEEVNMTSYTEGSNILPEVTEVETPIVPFIAPTEVNVEAAITELSKTKKLQGEGPWTRLKAKQATRQEVVDEELPQKQDGLLLPKEKGKNPLYNDGKSLFSEEDFPTNKSRNSSPSPKASVMVTDANDLEEIIRQLKQQMAEKDDQISALMAHISNQNAPAAPTKQVEEAETSNQSRVQIPTFSSQELKEMIGQSIREFHLSQSQPIIGYQKPYPSHFDAVPYPPGYSKPSFDKFDGMHGSPHEHLAHFYSACGETASSDALLIRQFVQSLKGSAFTWYTQLQPNSIDSWGELQRAFLAQFVNTKAKISIMDLANTFQKPNEGANDFIARWRTLRLQCPEKLSELACVQMCTNNLLPDLAVHVGSAEPLSFDALVSKACNVERQLARRPVSTPKVETKRQPAKKKEAMTTTVKVGQSKEKSSQKREKVVPNTNQKKEPVRRPTLEERQSKTYSFDNDDVQGIFDQLMASGSLILPEPKRPNQVNKTDHPKYCPYHRLISHTIEECYVLKDKIQNMIDEGDIEMDCSKGESAKASSSMLVQTVHPEDPMNNGFDEGIPTVSLPPMAIPVEFHTTQGIQIVWTYPGMPKARPDLPSLYEVLTCPNFDKLFPQDESFNDDSSGWEKCKRKTKPRNKTTFDSRPKGIRMIGKAPVKKSRKNKKKKEKELEEESDEEFEQIPRISFTLKDFLPKGFLEEEEESEQAEDASICESEETEQCYMVLVEEDNLEEEVGEVALRSGRQLMITQKKGKAPADKGNEPVGTTVNTGNGVKTTNPVTKEDSVQYDIVNHLKRIPSRLSIYDALQMSKNLRRALAQALLDPEDYMVHVDHVTEKVSGHPDTSCMATVSFSDEDLQLGDQHHNRPLYIAGDIKNVTINRILLDCGSAVNLLPFKTLKMVGLSVSQLTPTCLTIQGFNQVGQKAMGTIILKVTIEDLSTDVVFHVIDANTSYNVLLGRPWLHNSKVVVSTLHQCLKYTDENGIECMIRGDQDPFQGENVNYADAKFYKKITINSPASVASVPQSKPKEEKFGKSPKVKETPVEEKSESARSKCLFKFIPKSERQAGQKPIMLIDKTMNSLMTSYTRPLRKIDQSQPEDRIMIHATSEKEGTAVKSIVKISKTAAKAEMPKAKKKPLIISLHQKKPVLKAKRKIQNSLSSEVEIVKDEDLLIVKASEQFGGKKRKGPVIIQKTWPESVEPMTLTSSEQEMFLDPKEENSESLVVQKFNVQAKPKPSSIQRLKIQENKPRSSVFQRLDQSVFQRLDESVFKRLDKSVFERLEKPVKTSSVFSRLKDNSAKAAGSSVFQRLKMPGESKDKKIKINIRGSKNEEVNVITFSDESCQEVEVDDDSTEFINTVLPAPPELEDGGQPTVD